MGPLPDGELLLLNRDKPMTLKLSDFSTLTFDCYGTLIDWESGIWDALQPLLMANGGTDHTRTVLLKAFAQCEARQQKEIPDLFYPELLARVHAAIAESLGLTSTPQLDQDFGQSVPHWPAFRDTADALRALKKRYKLVILSNIYNQGIAASNRKLGVEFDAIYTAEDIGSYKPSDRNFQYMLDHLDADLGIKKSEILHTAQSLHHDHVPARKFGLANAWIDRQGLSNSDNWGATSPVAERPDTDFIFSTMGEMAAAVESESE